MRVLDPLDVERTGVVGGVRFALDVGRRKRRAEKDNDADENGNPRRSTHPHGEKSISRNPASLIGVLCRQVVA
jgi:hypothetical protein